MVNMNYRDKRRERDTQKRKLTAGISWRQRKAHPKNPPAETSSETGTIKIWVRMAGDTRETGCWKIGGGPRGRHQAFASTCVDILFRHLNTKVHSRSYSIRVEADHCDIIASKHSGGQLGYHT